eukprot:COSAG02_NODE_1295_length_13400_cov_5.691828_10_plen_72_part_00
MHTTQPHERQWCRLHCAGPTFQNSKEAQPMQWEARVCESDTHTGFALAAMAGSEFASVAILTCCAMVTAQS